MKKYWMCSDVTKVVLERMDNFPEEFFAAHPKCDRWKDVFREVYSRSNLVEKGYLRRARNRLKQAELMKQTMDVVTYDPPPAMARKHAASTMIASSNVRNPYLNSANGTSIAQQAYLSLSALERLNFEIEKEKMRREYNDLPVEYQKLYGAGAADPYQMQEYAKPFKISAPDTNVSGSTEEASCPANNS